MFRIAIRHRRRPNYEGRRRASTVPTNNTSSSCLNQSQKSEISEFERRVLAVLEGKRKLGTDTQAHVHGRLTAGAWSLLLQHFLKIKDNSNSASTTHQQLLLLEASNAYLRSAAYSVNLPNSLLDLVTSVERVKKTTPQNHPSIPNIAIVLFDC